MGRGRTQSLFLVGKIEAQFLSGRRASILCYAIGIMRGAIPGKHKPEDVVTIARESVGHHTVIIAQSGSGKSFFLGRLLEEIATKTRCRLLILDPNADFRRFPQVKKKELWTDPKEYSPHLNPKGGFLVDESTQKEFTDRWDGVSKAILSCRPDGIERSQLLKLKWTEIPIEFFLDEARPEDRDQVRHCHSLMGLLADLAAATGVSDWIAPGGLLSNARRFVAASEKRSREEIIGLLKDSFGLTSGPNHRGEPSAPNQSVKIVRLQRTLQTYSRIRADERGTIEDLEPVIQLAVTYRTAIGHSWPFYYGRALELQKSPLVELDVPRGQGAASDEQIRVVDLPSIADGRLQKMAVSTFLEAEWNQARWEWELALRKSDQEEDERVLTFIVVDEAHNMIPESGESIAERKLQEQFRRIAAEGRKFGLFLILVSQRPDKLDPMVTSECENRAIMKLGARYILERTQTLLGIDESFEAACTKVLGFTRGRVLLLGPWVKDRFAIFTSAARRTKEGGGDLRVEYWARREV
jgi:hypothetical protein